MTKEILIYDPTDDDDRPPDGEDDPLVDDPAGPGDDPRL